MRIYKITNKVDGKVYVGQTVQPLADRWRDHIRGDKQPDGYLHRAIQKYGAENFTIEEIDASKTLAGLNVLEEMHIQLLNCLAPNGYNLLPGGLNRRCHADVKLRISAALKGRSIPDRWIRGRSRPHSEETKQKISLRLKGRPFVNRWTKGNSMPRTEAQKDHLRRMNAGVPNVSLHKRVKCVETGVQYASVNSAAAAHNVNRVTMSHWLKTGKPGRIGLTFRFV